MGTWGAGLMENDHALDDAWDLLGRAGIEAPDQGDSLPPDLARWIGRHLRGVRPLLVGGERESLVLACRRRLDGLTRAPDLYRAADLLGAPLALLLAADAQVDAATLGRWREAFQRADAATGDERDFWDEYAGNVRAALDRLGASGDPR